MKKYRDEFTYLGDVIFPNQAVIEMNLDCVVSGWNKWGANWPGFTDDEIIQRWNNCKFFQTTTDDKWIPFKGKRVHGTIDAVHFYRDEKNEYANEYINLYDSNLHACDPFGNPLTFDFEGQAIELRHGRMIPIPDELGMNYFYEKTGLNRTENDEVDIMFGDNEFVAWSADQACAMLKYLGLNGMHLDGILPGLDGPIGGTNQPNPCENLQHVFEDYSNGTLSVFQNYVQTIPDSVYNGHALATKPSTVQIPITEWKTISKNDYSDYFDSNFTTFLETHSPELYNKCNPAFNSITSDLSGNPIYRLWGNSDYAFPFRRDGMDIDNLFSTYRVKKGLDELVPNQTFRGLATSLLHSYFIYRMKGKDYGDIDNPDDVSWENCWHENLEGIQDVVVSTSNNSHILIDFALFRSYPRPPTNPGEVPEGMPDFLYGDYTSGMKPIFGPDIHNFQCPADFWPIEQEFVFRHPTRYVHEIEDELPESRFCDTDTADLFGETSLLYTFEMERERWRTMKKSQGQTVLPEIPVIWLLDELSNGQAWYLDNACDFNDVTDLNAEEKKDFFRLYVPEAYAAGCRFIYPLYIEHGGVMNMSMHFSKNGSGCAPYYDYSDVYYEIFLPQTDFFQLHREYYLDVIEIESHVVSQPIANYENLTAQITNLNTYSYKRDVGDEFDKNDWVTSKVWHCGSKATTVLHLVNHNYYRGRLDPLFESDSTPENTRTLIPFTDSETRFDYYLNRQSHQYGDVNNFEKLHVELDLTAILPGPPDNWAVDEVIVRSPDDLILPSDPAFDRHFSYGDMFYGESVDFQVNGNTLSFNVDLLAYDLVTIKYNKTEPQILVAGYYDSHFWLNGDHPCGHFQVLSWNVENQNSVADHGATLLKYNNEPTIELDTKIPFEWGTFYSSIWDFSSQQNPIEVVPKVSSLNQLLFQLVPEDDVRQSDSTAPLESSAYYMQGPQWPYLQVSGTGEHHYRNDEQLGLSKLNLIQEGLDPIVENSLASFMQNLQNNLPEPHAKIGLPDYDPAAPWISLAGIYHSQDSFLVLAYVSLGEGNSLENLEIKMSCGSYETTLDTYIEELVSWPSANLYLFAESFVLSNPEAAIPGRYIIELTPECAIQNEIHVGTTWPYAHIWDGPSINCPSDESIEIEVGSDLSSVFISWENVDWPINQPSESKRYKIRYREIVDGSMPIVYHNVEVAEDPTGITDCEISNLGNDPNCNGRWEFQISSVVNDCTCSDFSNPLVVTLSDPAPPTEVQVFTELDQCYVTWSKFSPGDEYEVSFYDESNSLIASEITDVNYLSLYGYNNDFKIRAINNDEGQRYRGCYTERISYAGCQEPSEPYPFPISSINTYPLLRNQSEVFDQGLLCSGSWEVSLSIMNPRDLPADVTINYYDESGIFNSSEEIRIPAHGVNYKQFVPGHPISLGSIEISANSYVFGHVAHHFKANDEVGNPDFVTSYSGVLQRIDMRSESINSDWKLRTKWETSDEPGIERITTEIALKNYLGDPVSAVLNYFSYEGNQLGEPDQITVPGHGIYFKTMNDTSGYKCGSISAESPKSITGHVRRNYINEATDKASVEGELLATSSAASSAYGLQFYFENDFWGDDEWKPILYLDNPNPEPINVEIRVYDADGILSSTETVYILGNGKGELIFDQAMDPIAGNVKLIEASGNKFTSSWGRIENPESGGSMTLCKMSTISSDISNAANKLFIPWFTAEKSEYVKNKTMFTLSNQNDSPATVYVLIYSLEGDLLNDNGDWIQVDLNANGTGFFFLDNNSPAKAGSVEIVVPGGQNVVGHVERHLKNIITGDYYYENEPLQSFDW